MAAFGIAEEPIHSNGQWHLAGRCVTDIKVGMRFVIFFPSKFPDLANKDLIYSHSDPLTIDLTILEIRCYGRTFQKWDAGHTALVVLSGDGKNLQAFGTLATE